MDPKVFVESRRLKPAAPWAKEDPLASCIRMEFGIPGLPVSPIAIEAEAEALGQLGVGHVYSPSEGIPPLKEEASRFVKAFLDLDVPPSCCIPTVGAIIPLTLWRSPSPCLVTALAAPFAETDSSSVSVPPR